LNTEEKATSHEKCYNFFIEVFMVVILIPIVHGLPWGYQAKFSQALTFFRITFLL